MSKISEFLIAVACAVITYFIVINFTSMSLAILWSLSIGIMVLIAKLIID
jgi:hypothetical protein